MNDLQSLLSLPLGTLAVLAAGYIGYRIAYVGHDSTHSTIDVLFLTLTFSLVARLAEDLIIPHAGLVVAALGGIVAAVVGAAVWRSGLEDFSRRLLRLARISTSDRHLTAWDTVRLRRNFSPTWLMLRLTDGRRLLSSDLNRFASMRDGPCILGADGSVAMFVTERRAAQSEEWTPCDLTKEYFGTELTYIPAREISEIRIYVQN
jgi:hypothetical protein